LCQCRTCWAQHVRHWHKYTGAQLPGPRRFYFRSPSGATGGAAGNLAEFHRELLTCGADVLEHHLALQDFSRWLEGVIQDLELAADFRSIEEQTGAVPTELSRRQLLEAIEARYLE
jgi:hypothetical protein